MTGPFETLRAQGAAMRGLSSDSRRAGPGTAFLAYPGEAADGRAYIPDALARGAAAVLWEEAGFQWRAEWARPNAPVRGLKQRAGELAHEFYGRQSDSLWVCGVTGTNGKTSCSLWIAAALGGGVVGTLGYGAPGELAPLPNTTPDAIEVHRILKSFNERDLKSAAMEVSSHGLDQGRVNAVAFDCALFTNLSHDHLDYHRTMDAYAQAKARLFEMPGLQAAVLNLDDPFGGQLAARTAGRMHVIGYGFAATPAARVDEYLPARLLDGVQTGKVGRFNILNILGVTGVLRAYGLPLEEALAKVQGLPAVPGRMEKVADRPMVVVDYAHTPDALEKVLTALRPTSAERGGRLVAVFGAGGDRDPAKRRVMGEVAARLADRVLITSDNPRSEDPLRIIEQVKGATASEVEPDRARAIEQAIAAAAPADVVLVAGKGHETYQEIAGVRHPFSDAAVARAALARKNGGRSDA